MSIFLWRFSGQKRILLQYGDKAYSYTSKMNV